MKRIPNRGDPDGLLRVGGAWSHEEAEGKSNDDPDSTGPHSRLLTSVSCRLSSFHGSLTLCRLQIVASTYGYLYLYVDTCIYI